jgi:hypothetical protein
LRRIRWAAQVCLVNQEIITQHDRTNIPAAPRSDDYARRQNIIVPNARTRLSVAPLDRMPIGTPKTV